MKKPSSVSSLNYNYEGISNFQQGLDKQRERFKSAKIVGDYDVMADSLENIKSEIKNKLLKKDRKAQIIRIEKILEWYRNKENNYTRNTPDGIAIIFPPTMPNKINHNLTICFELIITEMDHLNLL